MLLEGSTLAFVRLLYSGLERLLQYFHVIAFRQSDTVPWHARLRHHLVELLL